MGDYLPTGRVCSCQHHTEIATWQKRTQNIRSAGFQGKLKKTCPICFHYVRFKTVNLKINYQKKYTINKQQVLAKMWRKENSHALLVALKIGTGAMENSPKVPQKI